MAVHLLVRRFFRRRRALLAVHRAGAVFAAGGILATIGGPPHGRIADQQTEESGDGQATAHAHQSSTRPRPRGIANASDMRTPRKQRVLRFPASLPRLDFFRAARFSLGLCFACPFHILWTGALRRARGHAAF